jgi:hypothetical protein
MRVLITVCLLFGLTACAQQPMSTPTPAFRPSATPAEKDAAADALVTCYVSEARKLDDGISDASVIGRAVASRCEKSIWHMAQVMGQSRDDASQLRLFEDLKTDAKRQATEVVLRLRVKARAP